MKIFIPHTSLYSPPPAHCRKLPIIFLWDFDCWTKCLSTLFLPSTCRITDWVEQSMTGFAGRQRGIVDNRQLTVDNTWVCLKILFFNQIYKQTIGRPYQ